MNEYWFSILIYCQLERASHLDDKQVPGDMSDKNFQDYFDSMVEFATMCGASEARARDEMLEVFKFQQSLRVSLK